MSLSVFDTFADMPPSDIDALIARAQADELTGADQELLVQMLPHIEELMRATIDSICGIFTNFTGIPWEPFASLGGKTYRTEPIPGAELGGKPRNPEADVIDEIDRIVDWQIKGGEGW